MPNQCTYCDESFERLSSYWWVEPSSLCSSCIKRYKDARETWLDHYEKKIKRERSMLGC